MIKELNAIGEEISADPAGDITISHNNTTAVIPITADTQEATLEYISNIIDIIKED